MIQQLQSAHSFALNGIGQSQSQLSNIPQNSFNNQLRATTPAITSLNGAQNTNATFTPALLPLANVPFPSVPSSVTTQNYLLNSASNANTENQQNLLCMQANGFMNNYSMNMMSSAPQTSLNSLSAGSFLGQNVTNTPQNSESQQNMLQLQMMNMKYKQIIQQQQQQLKQMQLQQLQQATQSQQQQQQLNQIYSQQIPLMNTTSTSSPFVQANGATTSLALFQNQLQNNVTNMMKPCVLPQYSTFLPQSGILSGTNNGQITEEALALYQDLAKVKIETNNTQLCQQISQFSVDDAHSQQQQQQTCSSSTSSPSQSSSYSQQQINKNECLSLTIIPTQQSAASTNDYHSHTQGNHLWNSQFSIQTVKTEKSENNASNTAQHQQNSSSKRQASFSTCNTKFDEDHQSSISFQNEKCHLNFNKENSNSDKKRKHSIAIGSRPNNIDIDTQSHSSFISHESFNKKNNQIEEVIYKQRFVQVKQEEELQLNSNNSCSSGSNNNNNNQSNDIKCVSISQQQQHNLQQLPKRMSHSILSASAAPHDERSSMLSNFDVSSQKQDTLYQDFSRLSSFDNLQEAARSFDKLLNKLSVTQTVDLILSTLPSKPEEQTNFENKFVNSMKAKQSKDKRNPNALYMTRFHNLTRLLMYNIVQLFSFDILSQNLNVHFYIAQELENICRKIKQHARQTCNGQFKTDFYTHSHYNGLFLILDKNTISHIKKSQKDIEIHQQVYGLDLIAAANPDEKIEFDIKKCNFFKLLAHEILMKCSYQSAENTLINGDDARRIYFRRALSGISKLNKGQIVHRF